MKASSMRIKYGEDKVLELSLDTRDFFIDGKKGSFPSIHCRDFILAVITSAPKTATFRHLEKTLGVNTSYKKLQHAAKAAFYKSGLKVPVLEAVRAEGYQLAANWSKVDGELGAKHFAYQLLSDLSLVIENACKHVESTNLQTNSIGLMFVERTQSTRNLVTTNYTIIEDIGWQLIHVLSSSGVTNTEHPYILEVKKKIEKIISRPCKTSRPRINTSFFS